MDNEERLATAEERAAIVNKIDDLIRVDKERADRAAAREALARKRITGFFQIAGMVVTVFLVLLLMINMQSILDLFH